MKNPYKNITAKLDPMRHVEIGKALSYSVGSDSYGYWIVDVDRKNKLVGVYTPRTKFEFGWADGHMTAEAFCPTHKPDMYLKVFRNCWYEYDVRTGKRVRRHCRMNCTDEPRFYRDPSF